MFHEILGSIFVLGREKKKIDRLCLNYLYFTNILIKKFTLFGVYGKTMWRRNKKERTLLKNFDS
jgi:hypothetical protein